MDVMRELASVEGLIGAFDTEGGDEASGTDELAGELSCSRAGGGEAGIEQPGDNLEAGGGVCLDAVPLGLRGGESGGDGGHHAVQGVDDVDKGSFDGHVFGS